MLTSLSSSSEPSISNDLKKQNHLRVRVTRICNTLVLCFLMEHQDEPQAFVAICISIWRTDGTILMEFAPCSIPRTFRDVTSPSLVCRKSFGSFSASLPVILDKWRMPFENRFSIPVGTAFLGATIVCPDTFDAIKMTTCRNAFHVDHTRPWPCRARSLAFWDKAQGLGLRTSDKKNILVVLSPCAQSHSPKTRNPKP